MPLIEDFATGLNITGYDEQQIHINNESYQQNILLSPNKVYHWSIDINNIKIDDFDLIIKLQPEVFIFGTGADRINIDTKLYINLLNQRIGVEIMNTQAACRTFNVLSSENRNVIAGLII
jgi:uncharacterized protein